MNKNTSAFLLLSAILLSFGSAVTAAPLTLVKDGQPQAKIVIAQNASEFVKFGASDMQRIIKRMSAAKLPITKVQPGATADKGVRIVLGTPEYNPLIAAQKAQFKDDL